jgi:type II secretory pathway component PulK
VALVTVLVVMVVVSVVLAVVTAQVVSQQRMVHQRQLQLQSEWLARAGVELAAARLLEEPGDFSEERRDLAPDARVRITVKKLDGEVYLVTAEAEVGVQERPTVARTASVRFQRTEAGGSVRLQALPPPNKAG